MLLKKKPLSQELKLEQILLDIKNIAHANPNAALSQIRTFVDIYTSGVLIYESEKTDLELVHKINLIEKYSLLSKDEISIMHQIRKTGNNAVHSYYYSNEEVATYFEVCFKIYEKFINKYESDRINYNKKLMRTYIHQVKDRKTLDNEESKTLEIEKNYNGKLISEKSVISPKEDFNIKDLDEYENIRSRVLKNIYDVNSISKELEISDENLNISLTKLKENKFNLVVLGEFNRGKSTFLNALLGKVILPSNILPTTSVITRISYEDEPKVKVTLNNGQVKHIQPEELVNYVTTLNGNDSTHIEITDVYYPTKFCKNGCIITDTPGVNDLNDQNIVITEKYIPQADAVIFMMDPDQVLTESEKYFIKNKILKNDINKIFFIVNKFDTINESGINNFKKYVHTTLRELNLDSNVYFLSSKISLICKVVNKDDEYLNAFDEFSNDLESFLIEQKGKYLLLNACSRLRNTLDKVILNIYEIEADMLKSIEKLEQDHLEFKKVSNEVKINKGKIIQEIDRKYIDFRNEVKTMVYKELSSSFDNLVQGLYKQEDLNDSIFRDLESNINKHINKWINVRINPFILTKVNQINDELVSLLNKSLKDISKSNTYDISINSEEIEVVQSSKFELPTCYNTVSLESDVNTFVGAGAVITMLFTGTLLSGIGGAFLGLIAHEMFGQKSTSYIKSKEEIIKSIESQKRNCINNIMKGIENSIDKSYKQNCKYIDDSINVVLENTSKRMSSILNERKKQDSNMDFVIDKLNSYLKELYIIKKHNQFIIKSLEG